eukprot:m.159959 g.159959  ORF g.159959 m.159959 type:complete len:676 (+) comp17048_c2_seq1:188-2215(+)
MAKAGQLAIQREEFGYVQRSAWRQADRLHEEVIDLDSPFSVSLAAGTHLYTFVLIGDQNAGKSTFLHSFACYQDENYLELSSLLPVLSSSFLNTRFLPEGDNRRAIDEPPFLDTDIARGTIAMVLDDFAFFVEEHNLDHSLVLDLPKGTRFVVVQFIEFGGDHLDQLMDASLIGSQRIADIVERSREMLRECRKIVYFVNGHTLFRDAAEQGCLHAASMATLERRLAFLNSSLLPADVGVMVHMTRPPAALSPETAAHILASTRAALHISGEDDASSAASTTAAAAVDAPELSAAERAARVLAAVLSGLRARHAWHLNLSERVTCADQVDPFSGSLVPEAIVNTLACMFRTEMMKSGVGQAQPDLFAAQHMLACYKEPERRLLPPDDTLDMFLDQEAFRDYLDDLHFSEAPVPILLQRFHHVALRLAAAGLAVLDHAASAHAPLRITVVGGVAFTNVKAGEASSYTCCAGSDGGGAAGSDCIDYVSGDQSNSGSGDNSGCSVRVRFPTFVPLMRVVESYFSHNVPGELWLDAARPLFAGTQDPELYAQLEAAATALGAKVVELLPLSAVNTTPQEAAAGGAAGGAGAGSDSLQAWHLWLWMAEEYALAQRLLRREQQPSAVRLPLPQNGVSPAQRDALLAFLEGSGFARVEGGKMNSAAGDNDNDNVVVYDIIVE